MSIEVQIDIIQVAPSDLGHSEGSKVLPWSEQVAEFTARQGFHQLRQRRLFRSQPIDHHRKQVDFAQPAFESDELGFTPHPTAESLGDDTGVETDDRCADHRFD
jgi:hypothetical protein